MTSFDLLQICNQFDADTDAADTDAADTDEEVDIEGENSKDENVAPPTQVTA